MLALLKPWRDLCQLKFESETWESAFKMFVENACQWDKDVIAGCQYYYESKNVAANGVIDNENDFDVNEDREDENPVKDNEENNVMNISVSATDVFLIYLLKPVSHLLVMKMSNITKDCKDMIKNTFMVS